MKKIVKYIFIFWSAVVFSQNITVFYKVKKSCQEISLGAVVDQKYYKDYTTLKENKIKNLADGKFEVKVNQQFPLPYSLMCTQDTGFKPSALFTVSKEDLKFELDSIGMFIQPLPLREKKSALINDQYKFHISFFKLLNIFYNSESENLKLENLLVEYSKENPESYMLFWTLVQHFQYRGFKESYLTAFKNLSSKIRNSEYGKMFYNDMMKSLKLSEHSVFPDLEFKGKKILSSLGKKYTLIDFWFSSCQPCLVEIPKYKKLYSKFKDKGFEIVSISTDRTVDKRWEKVVKEKSKLYNVNSFPTTFLLDFTGAIVKKNISLEELDGFLENKLHDKEYFKTFKKNEEPENKKFHVLKESSNINAAYYYVIYKENALGEGFYFKVVFDKNEKPIATYYASEEKQINDSTVQNLKNILGEPSALTNSLEETPAQCVTKCHRTNHCYDKATNTGVLLCSLDCQASCA